MCHLNYRRQRKSPGRIFQFWKIAGAELRWELGHFVGRSPIDYQHNESGQLRVTDPPQTVGDVDPQRIVVFGRWRIAGLLV
jgi:hypothetical protein